ncbi:MAG: hypothetical protein U0166_12405 [Acidobacteriota bacterium]
MRKIPSRASWFLAGALALAFLEHVVIRASGAPPPTPPPSPAPSFWDKTVGTLSDTAEKYTGDEAIADYVMASVEKQERVNAILTRRGSRYRITDLHVDIGVSPALAVGIMESPSTPPSPKP